MIIITDYKNGLDKNYLELLKHGLYKDENNGSFFKFAYDNFKTDENLSAQNISSIIAYESNIPIAVLLFFHRKNSLLEFESEYLYSNVGEVGVFVKKDFRNQDIARKLFQEFEKKFLRFHSEYNDYVVVETFEDAYPVAMKSFKWFIPTNKRDSVQTDILSIKSAIKELNRRSLKYYNYNNKI